MQGPIIGQSTGMTIEENTAYIFKAHVFMKGRYTDELTLYPGVEVLGGRLSIGSHDDVPGTEYPQEGNPNFCYTEGDFVVGNDWAYAANFEMWDNVFVEWNSTMDPCQVGKKIRVTFESESVPAEVSWTSRPYTLLNVQDHGVYLDDCSLVKTYVSVSEADNRTLVEEDGGSDSYTIVLLKALTGLDTVTITIDPCDEFLDDAHPDSPEIVHDPSYDIDLGNGVGKSIVLSFTSDNWNIPQTVTVTAYDDDVVEYTREIVGIEHTCVSSTSDYHGAAVRDIKVCVIDNEVLRINTNSTISVSEEGTTSDTFTVDLQFMEPGSEIVMVDIAPDPCDVQVSVLPIQLIFTSDNYATPQTVTVTAIDDLVAEDDPHPGVIKLVGSGGSGDYDGITAEETADVYENDCGAWLYQEGDVNKDCIVNLNDFRGLARDWLGCTRPNDNEGECIDLL